MRIGPLGHLVRLAIAAVVLLSAAAPVWAQKAITQAKVNNGGFTPGDVPGFPLTISVRGSYKLTGNLEVNNVDTTAIVITADNVTIDLNGFGIYGPGGAGAGDGIYALQSNVTVVNGSVRGMGRDGINLGGNSHLVEKVFAMENGRNGILCQWCIVSASTANFNFNGIAVDTGSLVTGNTASRNFSAGLLLPNSGGAGYMNNVLHSNRVNVMGGINLGHNICGAQACP